METNRNDNTIQLPANMVIDRVEEDKIFLKPAFKDEDILISGSSGEPFIYNGKYDIEEDSIGCYLGIASNGKLSLDLPCPTSYWSSFSKARKATEQEKEKLFKAISDAGYEWDEQLKELKESRKELPKTWEEFCHIYLGAEEEEYYIGIAVLGEEKAKAMRSFIQLIHLRDCYRNGWEPKAKEIFYCIESSLEGDIFCCCGKYHNEVLSFQSEEIRDMFLENFRDLIEQAKEFI